MAIGGTAVFTALSEVIRRGSKDLSEFQGITNRLSHIMKTSTGATDEQVKALISSYHASEIALLFESLTQESRERMISLLPTELASEVISEMDAELHPEKLLESLQPARRSKII